MEAILSPKEKMSTPEVGAIALSLAPKSVLVTLSESINSEIASWEFLVLHKFFHSLTIKKVPPKMLDASIYRVALFF